jgi:hypothetical protein
MAFAKNAQATVIILARDTAGALKVGATLASQVSLDGGAFANTTNSAAEIGSTGIYSLTLTAAEMNAGVVTVRWSGTGVVSDALVVYTESDWTSTRAGYVDRLDAPMSTRAPAATALTNGTWTEGRAAKLDNLDAAVSSRGTADPGDEMALASGAVAQVVSATLGGSVAFADGSTATVADCLVAARTQGAGDWALAGTTLTMKSPAGGTQYRFSLTLNGQGNPMARALE